MSLAGNKTPQMFPSRKNQRKPFFNVIVNVKQGFILNYNICSKALKNTEGQPNCLKTMNGISENAGDKQQHSTTSNNYDR